MIAKVFQDGFAVHFHKLLPKSLLELINITSVDRVAIINYPKVTEILGKQPLNGKHEMRCIE